MTILQVMDESGQETLLRTSDVTRIGDELAERGIRFEQWSATKQLDDSAGPNEVLEAYRDDIDRLCAAQGFKLVDVIRMRPDPNDPDWPDKAKAAREKFIEEHTHDEDEVRFFVEGLGCFYLHIGDRVYAVVCEAGDLLSVPTGTTHWFDMGGQPRFCAIRFFQEEDGWVGSFTDSPISARIPSLDALLASA